MGSFFSLHYRFNLFFRFPLLRVSHHQHRPRQQHLYEGSERIAEQWRNISGGSQKDLILDQCGGGVGRWVGWRVRGGTMGTFRWESTISAYMGGKKVVCII